MYSIPNHLNVNYIIKFEYNNNKTCIMILGNFNS